VTPRLSYVLPVHNQERVVRESVDRLVEQLQQFPGSEVILVENGSTDRSPAICSELARRHAQRPVPVIQMRSRQGMGYALRCGIERARGDVIVLTAADLPFGFTDLDAYLGTDPRPRLAIGSKAHPLSHTRIPVVRRSMSAGFALLRRALLGLRVGDSQGTLLIESRLAEALASHLRCGDFLITTEIVAWAEHLGVTPVELPISYSAGGGSTVSPLRDSVRMAGGLLALRRRLRHASRTRA
jgi:hypothetical protein